MHKNNFDFQRLLFATMVMYTHCFALTGHGNNDLVRQLTDGQIELSHIGVRGFFVISGYLIFQSMERSRDIVDYLWKRLLRLYPALLVMLGLTVLVAWLVYDGSDGSFWSKKDALSYLPKNATLYWMQGQIKGVFDDNVYPSVINGSFWTICYEFTAYLGLGLLFFLRRQKNLVRILLLVGFLGCLYLDFFCQDAIHKRIVLKFLYADRGVDLAAYFIAGSILASFKFENWRGKGWIFLGALIALTLLAIFHQFLTTARFLFLPFVFLVPGLLATPYLRDVGKKFGDMSYGIYIYGFVVQQTLMHYFDLGIWSLMAISIPITYALGFASWHLLEKRALELKRIHPTQWLAGKLGLRSAK